MREIKFRAWNIETESYMEAGFDFRVDGNGNVYLRAWGETVWDRTTNLVLEQYTDLKDNTGKEIYEGDIVKIMTNHARLSDEKDKYRNEIVTKGCSCGLNTNGMISIQKEGEKEYKPQLEVIGNIHQREPKAIESTRQRAMNR